MSIDGNLIKTARWKFSGFILMYHILRAKTIGQSAEFVIVALVARLIIEKRHKRITINSFLNAPKGP